MATMKARVTSFAPQFLVDDLERSIAYLLSLTRVPQVSGQALAGQGEEAMLIPVATILAVQIAAGAVSVGVAAASQDGQVCVAIPEPALTSGTPLTLIRPDGRQSALVAAIVRSLPACERLERAMIPGPYYLARRHASIASESGTLWVAFVGRFETRRVGSGAIGARLSAAYPNVQVRSCTSHEGLHLTVWSGTPLTSQRLWHLYYYLGYDVAPSCDGRELRDPPDPPPQPSGGTDVVPESSPLRTELLIRARG